jgi:hypothetical protein
VPTNHAPGELTRLAYATAAAVGTLRLQASATISGSLVQSNAVDIVVSAAPAPPPPPPPPPPPHPLDRALNLIAAAPDNSWVELTTNTFESAWSPADLRRAYPYDAGSAVDSPTRIMGAWSSCGVDPDGNIVLWGGGHANIMLSEVYRGSIQTGQWSCAYFGARLFQVDSFPTYRSIDANSTPVSSHCYGNNNWLPILGQFFTGGGAAAGDGSSLRVWGGTGNNTRLRDAGGFTLSMAQAGQGKVAGTTGSNIKFGAFASTDIEGANAWTLRDWAAINPELMTTGPSGNQCERIEQGTAVGVEGGKDCIYFEANNRMWKAVVDANPSNDVVTRITGPQNALNNNNGALALSPDHQVLLRPNGGTASGGRDSRRFYFVDLKDLSLDLGYKQITSLTNEGVTGFLSDTGLNKSAGVCYHEHLGKFVLWSRGRQPYLISVPSGNPTPTTGWSVEAPTMDAVTPAPNETLEANDSGVIGKFKYAKNLRCPIAVQGLSAGKVWALKLAGWTDPRA